MKGYAAFFVIAVMSLGLVFLLVTRSRTPHDAPFAEPTAVEGDGGADAEGGDARAAQDGAVEAAAPKSAERPLRIAALGWELVAAGVALASPDGRTTPAMEPAPETTLDAVEARLARGGTDPVGADVAIMPLPAFVLAYERLRALDPRAFAVVGFSHGREEVHAAPGALLKPPPAADEVKIVALGPATASDPATKAAGTESATLLGLFTLDLLGVAPARVRLVGPGGADAKAALFAAIVRGAVDERKLALSTADASRLVPIVAIAPKQQLETNDARLRELTRAWLDGLDRVGKDASSVARRLSNKEALPLGAGIGGAPEAIALLERLGQIVPVGLVEQRTAIHNLAPLAQRTWILARGGGLTSIAAPEPLPIDERIATQIAPAAKVTPPQPSTGDAGTADVATLPPLQPGATPLVVYRAVDPQADAASVAAQIGFLAGIFEHAAFRVSAKGGEKAARAIAASVRERFELAPTRLATAPGEPAGAFASVEILALP